MTNVVAFTGQRVERDASHVLAGKCDRCGHRDLMDFATGLARVRCEKCGCVAMRRAEPVLPPDETECIICPSCVGIQFSVCRDHLLCNDCGQTVREDWSQAG